jgi:hypothetical protein
MISELVVLFRYVEQQFADFCDWLDLGHLPTRICLASVVV